MSEHKNPFRNSDGSDKPGYERSAKSWDDEHPIQRTSQKVRGNPFLDEFGCPRKGYEKSAAHWNPPTAESQDDDFYRSYEWRRVRHDALKRSNGRCALCGRRASDNLQLHVDHIKPRSKHPECELDINNLQVLCADCNLGKGNRDS